MADDDDWGLSMEELDSIERSAAQQLAARRSAGSPLIRRPELLARTLDGRAPVVPVARSLEVKVSKEDGKINLASQYDKDLVAAYKTVPGREWDPSRKLWSFSEDRLQDVVAALLQVSNLDLRIEPVAPLTFPPLVAEMISGKTDAPSAAISPQSSPAKSQETPRTPSKPLLVKIYSREDGRIAAKSSFHEGARQAFQTVQGKSWNSEERVWTFPRTSLLDLVSALRRISEITIEIVPPLELPSDAHVNCSPGPKVSAPIALDGDYACSRSSPGTGGTPKEKPRVQLFLHSSGVVAIRSSSSMTLMPVLKSIPRAFWNHKERLWMFPPSSLAEAERLLSAVSVVEPLPPIVKRALDYSCRLQDLSDKYALIPSYLEESLLPFQRDGVRFVLKHGARALIADEMGLGKTVQAIAIASCLRDEWPVLVVVPSSLRIQWAVMLKTWLRLSPCDITVVLSQGSAASREGFKIVHSAGKAVLELSELSGAFNIISYDMVTKLRAYFKVVIADESHYMKNAQAKRTNACVPLIQKARYAVLLTGTPALSRPIELYKQLEALQSSVYLDVHEYGQRYCSGGLFGLHQGSSNQDELHALLKSTVMIRRLKREVLTELPEKLRQQVFLSLDTASTKQLRALFQELKKLRDNVQGSLEDGVEKLKAEEKILITKIYSESAVAKLTAVQEYLSIILEADCKFLVFAHHQYMMDGIEEHFKKKKTGYIRIDGGTPAAARQNLVTRFQQSEGVKAALLSIRAAGVGLTLTAASTVVFAEMSWTPGDMVQAEDRAHRLGQKSSVNIYYLHAQDTIDDLIWESVRHKLENLGQVLNGKQERLDVVPSPPKLSQRLLTGYLRPCGMLEESDQDSQSELKSSKRCRLFFG